MFVVILYIKFLQRYVYIFKKKMNMNFDVYVEYILNLGIIFYFLCNNFFLRIDKIIICNVMIIMYLYKKLLVQRILVDFFLSKFIFINFK